MTAAAVRSRLKEKGWRLEAEYDYGPGLRKVRFTHTSEFQRKGKPKKTCIWEHSRDRIWYSTKGDKKNPVYLNRVARERDQLETALGVEGENKADAAADFGYAAFSMKELTKENAVQLAGIDITIWRDKDEDGLKLQRRVIEYLKPHARSIRIVDPLLLNDLPESGDIIDAIAAGYDADRIAAVLDGAQIVGAPQTAANRRKSPTVLELADVMKLEVIRPEMAVEGILPTPGCTLLVGREKTGKTLLAVQIGMCLAAGQHLFQNYRIAKPGAVMLIEVDDPAGAASLRLLLEKTDIPISGKPFFTVAEPELRLSSDFLVWLRGEIAAKSLSLVILDAYTSLRPARQAGGDLVKAEAAEIASLDRLAKDTGCAFLLIHHESKGGSGLDWSARAAGSYAVTAAVEAVISISRFQDLEGNAPEQWIRIRGRHIEDRELVLRLRTDFLNFELVLDNSVAGLYPQARQLKAAFRENSFSPKETTTETGLSRATVFRLLARLTSAAILRKDGHGNYRFGLDI
jgi:hypothetical protein